MRFGSLFSGIGGLDLGLERAGMECVWQVEIDDYCTKVLEKHWPDVPKHGDIKEIESLPYVDLICGGFPCPPVSQAASYKREFDDDSRWLWPEFRRIIRQVRPRYVLVENVRGLLSADGGRLFGGILRDFSNSGYDAEWESLPAQAFGAPHLRHRVFIMAYPKRREGEGERWGGIMRRQRVTDETGKTTERWDYNQARVSVNGFGEWWQAEPRLGRLVDGVPSRVDQLRGFGNAVVPQVAEWIGRRIMEAEVIGE